jgi:FkbM family methyltransferase
MRPKGDPSAMVRALIEPGMVAVDVGASNGCFTKVLLDGVGLSGAVHAIEPHPEHHKAFAERCFPPNVTLHKGVALDRTGSVNVFLAHNTQETTVYEKVLDKWDAAPLVPCWRLDDLVPQANLVKIDAQGAEGAILAGAQHLLSRCDAWIIELWPRGLEAAGESAQRLVTALVMGGLEPHWADGEVITLSNLQHWQENAKQEYVNITATR